MRKMKNHRKDMAASRSPDIAGPNPFPPVKEKTVMEFITTSSGFVRNTCDRVLLPPFGLVDA